MHLDTVAKAFRNSHEANNPGPLLRLKYGSALSTLNPHLDAEGGSRCRRPTRLACEEDQL